MPHLLFSVILAADAAMAAFVGVDTTRPPSRPQDSCSQLVRAAKANDTATLIEWTTHLSPLDTVPTRDPDHPTGTPKHGEVLRVPQPYILKLKNMSTCTSELIMADHAVVAAKGQGPGLLLPFIHESGKWKLDVYTFDSFYQEPTRIKRQDSGGK